MNNLKNYRAPRDPWPWIFAGAIVVAALAIVGPVDFASDLQLEAELKVLRAERAASRLLRAELAPIRPTRRCGEEPFIAWQADGGRWFARCTPSADLRSKR